jgi:hypothetical protein
MKFAEALALRADAARRAEQLRARLMANARRWDGERPAEDSLSLLGEAARVLDELETLVRRTNRATR